MVFRQQDVFTASGVGEVRWFQDGTNTFVELDSGDGIADALIRINGLVGLRDLDFVF